jgi:5-methylcytosine-specific restriction endonuclease McrA
MPKYARDPFETYRAVTKRWYDSPRWRRRASWQIHEHPLCVKCLAIGMVTPSTVADHIIPHRGDARLFWMGDLQSLCWEHHSGVKALEEKHGYDPTIGADGWPIDARHPANKA